MAIEMNIRDLYSVGESFESCVGSGTKSERSRIPKNTSRINLSDSLINKIANYQNKVNCLVSGEIWCPDFQLNISVLKKFMDLNDNFDISVITMARGKKFLSEILGIDKDSFKGPTIVFLDENFNTIGIFEERPKSVRAFENFEDVKLDYYKGKYLLDTVNDYLDILNIK
ncbi:thioredoxin family protein [Paraclostridium bifermentans]|uniref:thioredoxin family protein n=1 Tax=Paraclostridium bifermentans TaxID=1490 RepID=UPI00359C109A